MDLNTEEFEALCEALDCWREEALHTYTEVAYLGALLSDEKVTKKAEDLCEKEKVRRGELVDNIKEKLDGSVEERGGL